MSKSKDTEYYFLSQLFLRAPYYSFNGYDLARLPEVLSDQAFQNAVWLASPDFYRVLEGKEFDYSRMKDKERHTLFKYYNRMCFRPTPFGSFASFTLLNWGKDGQIKLATNNRAVLHLLPDQQLLHLARTISDQLDRNSYLMINPSLYRMDKAFRYTKSTVSEKGKYNFSLEAIAAVNFNTHLFSYLGNGPVPVPDVINWIVQHGECSEAEAVDYLRFLLSEQVVYNESQGHIVDFDSVLENPLKISGWNDFWKTKASIAMDSTFSLAKFSSEIKLLSTVFTEKSVAQPFYAALERQAESGGPDQREQVELSKAIDLLNLLADPQQPADLSRFIKDFKERFDLEKVPLLIALDSDAGLPYGNLNISNPNSGVLENLKFPEAESDESHLAWSAVQQFLFRRWIGDPLRDPWSPLQINKEDIKELQNRRKNEYKSPQTQAVMYRNTGEYLVIDHAGGVTASSLIGRFSCFSDAIHGFCRQLAEVEINANPDVVFADIGALSDTHVDNINRRKLIYNYEIPVNVFSSQPVEEQIKPDDLFLSVRDNELILESAALGKRIIPRLATAYNFRHNHLPVFRLLCDLQFQGLKAGLSFDLENLFPGLPYYPRLECGRAVISAAKWNFKEPDLIGFNSKEPDELLGELQAFRRKHHMPRHISMGNYDQQLVFDLAHTSEALFFLQCIKGLKTAAVQEYFMPDRSVLAGKKPLAGQFIAFLAHKEIIYPERTLVKNRAANHKGRSFMIGSNWLYLKIFCTPRAADTILANVIHPFISGQRTIIKNWFFIRYADKGYHLRLRIQADKKDLGALLVALNKKLTSGGFKRLVRDYHGDTYRREIERYSLRLIPHIEDFFCSGSDLVTWYIRARETEKISWNDFELAVFTAERIIDYFLLTDESCLHYLNQVTERFLLEFRADKQLKIGLDSKYREVKSAINNLSNTKLKVTPFDKFIKQLNFLVSLTSDYSDEQKFALLADLVHMQLNRTFLIQQRQQELLVYYCLQKHKQARMARSKTGS